MICPTTKSVCAYGVKCEYGCIHPYSLTVTTAAVHSTADDFAAMVKDAERMQWMSEHWGYAEGMIFFEGFNLGANTTLREAIDAAKDGEGMSKTILTRRSEMSDYKLTAGDYAMVRYFALDKGDVTRWCGWEKLKPIFRRLHPEFVAAVEQLTIAERTLKTVVNSLPEEPVV